MAPRGNVEAGRPGSLLAEAESEFGWDASDERGWGAADSLVLVLLGGLCWLGVWVLSGVPPLAMLGAILRAGGPRARRSDPEARARASQVERRGIED